MSTVRTRVQWRWHHDVIVNRLQVKFADPMRIMQIKFRFKVVKMSLGLRTASQVCHYMCIHDKCRVCVHPVALQRDSKLKKDALMSVLRLKWVKSLPTWYVPAGQTGSHNLLILSIIICCCLTGWCSFNTDGFHMEEQSPRRVTPWIILTPESCQLHFHPTLI